MATFDNGYALIIGIAKYHHIRPLPDTVLNDANDMKALLVDAAQCGYSPTQVKLLLDNETTHHNIRLGLHWLAERTKPDDTVIIFFSGHGGRIESGPQTGNYLIPIDTDPADLKKTAIDSETFTQLLGEIKAGRLLVLFDCCHAGGTGEIKDFLPDAIPDFKAGLDERYYDQLATGQGRVIIASSRSTEASWILPDMRNSLFSHYLLEALRGQAHTYDDGLIRILDIFNFIAEAVPQRCSQQHPILKAELEANFPIALYQGGRQYPHAPQPGLRLENPKKLPFPAQAEEVVRTMFAGYQRVIVEKEFGGGFSGGQVFLISPIRSNNIRELPAIVKLASVSLIQQEWQAYHDYIRDRLPHSTGVQGQPVLPPDSAWGGLRYPLVGSGKFAIQSLYNYCRHASLADITFTLERLLKVLEPLMQPNRTSPAFYLQASYDPILPVNLMIEPATPPPGVQPVLLTPTNLPDRPFQHEDYVRLEGFIITKVDLVNQTINLNVPAKTTEPPASYCLRLQGIGDLAAYQVHQLIPPIEGKVIETRAERLQAEARRALGHGFNLASDTLTLPDGMELPNPLAALPAILSQYPDVKIGCVHGDLNLENILVDPATRDVSLIDFAAAREDHLLHDFLRLETEVVTKLIPEILAKANLGPAAIRRFYEQLHQVVVHGSHVNPNQLPHPTLDKPLAILTATRKAARRYMLNPDDWTEYYQGLTLYLLGAMKFGNLDKMPEAPGPLPKQVAFWGAATVVGVMNSKPNGRPTNTIKEGKERKTDMATSKRVFKINGAEDAEVTIAGNTIAKNVAVDTISGLQAPTEVEVDLTNLKRGKYEIAGEHVLLANQSVTILIDELARLISKTLVQPDDIDDLQEIVTELKIQAEKSISQRNASKVKRLLGNMRAYLESAPLADSQAEQAQNLLSQVKGLL